MASIFQPESDRAYEERSQLDWDTSSYNGYYVSEHGKSVGVLGLPCDLNLVAYKSMLECCPMPCKEVVPLQYTDGELRSVWQTVPDAWFKGALIFRCSTIHDAWANKAALATWVKANGPFYDPYSGSALNTSIVFMKRRQPPAAPRGPQDFVELVRRTSPIVYGGFCQIMSQYQKKRMPLQSVLSSVNALFRGNAKLLNGFRTFVQRLTTKDKGPRALPPPPVPIERPLAANLLPPLPAPRRGKQYAPPSHSHQKASSGGGYAPPGPHGLLPSFGQTQYPRAPGGGNGANGAKKLYHSQRLLEWHPVGPASTTTSVSSVPPAAPIWSVRPADFDPASVKASSFYWPDGDKRPEAAFRRAAPRPVPWGPVGTGRPGSRPAASAAKDAAAPARDEGKKAGRAPKELVLTGQRLGIRPVERPFGDQIDLLRQMQSASGRSCFSSASGFKPGNGGGGVVVRPLF